MGGIVSMKLKAYERTGIKEEKNLRESQAKLIERQNSEQEIKRSIELGRYRENCRNKYDLNLMNFEKEYQRTTNLLSSYRLYEDNIGILLQGYYEYLHTYGSSMTALGLREFRKSIESGVRQAWDVEKKKKREAQIENAVLDFVIECYDDIEHSGGQINVLDIMYLMYELNLNIKSEQACEEITSKIKTIYDELKNS